MPKLIVLVGPPASGKTSLAMTFSASLEPDGNHFLRINQDDDGRIGHLTLFKSLVEGGRNIVIDRLNFNKEQRKRYLQVARDAGYKTKIIVLHENRETCFKRCMDRKGHPTITTEEHANSALNMFFKRYERPSLDEADEIEFRYPKVENHTAIICDIDSTLSNTDHRQHYMRNGKKNWTMFFNEMDKDPVHEFCKQIVNTMRGKNIIILSSGRPSNYREITKNWLEQHRVMYDFLFMRPRDDSRPDTVIKEIILDFEILTRVNNILFCIDDRKCIIDFYRSRGLTVLDVAGERGNF